MLGQAYRRVYEGVNYRLRSVAGARWAAHCRPTSIGILLTNICNARCVHCNIWQNRGQPASPGLEKWKSVLSDLRDWLGPVHVFFSGGEALLVPFATELVAHGSRIGLSIEVLSHGYWEDQSKIEKLALARPWRITISLDGMSQSHTLIRGRDGFFEKTVTSIRTLQRMRREHDLKFSVLLKTVVMSQNLDEVRPVAEYAAANGLRVFYQAIEQNYNTLEDPRWFETSPNWPKDPSKAVAAVRQLIELKRKGLPIENSLAQIEAMIPYFEDPDSSRVATNRTVPMNPGFCAQPPQPCS